MTDRVWYDETDGSGDAVHSQSPSTSAAAEGAVAFLMTTEPGCYLTAAQTRELIADLEARLPAPLAFGDKVRHRGCEALVIHPDPDGEPIGYVRIACPDHGVAEVASDDLERIATDAP